MIFLQNNVTTLNFKLAKFAWCVIEAFSVRWNDFQWNPKHFQWDTSRVKSMLHGFSGATEPNAQSAHPLFKPNVIRFEFCGRIFEASRQSAHPDIFYGYVKQVSSQRPLVVKIGITVRVSYWIVEHKRFGYELPLDRSSKGSMKFCLQAYWIKLKTVSNI